MEVAEASTLMRELAQPVPVKVALFAAQEALSSWSANRVRDVFHADPRVRLDPIEAKELRAAAQAKREAIGAADYRTLRDRLDRLEAAVRAQGTNLDFPPTGLGGDDAC